MHKSQVFLTEVLRIFCNKEMTGKVLAVWTLSQRLSREYRHDGLSDKIYVREREEGKNAEGMVHATARLLARYENWSRAVPVTSLLVRSWHRHTHTHLYYPYVLCYILYIYIYIYIQHLHPKPLSHSVVRYRLRSRPLSAICYIYVILETCFRQPSPIVYREAISRTRNAPRVYSRKRRESSYRRFGEVSDTL